MNREQFDHAIRAAGSVLGVEEVLVVGSQAIHGSLASNIPPEAQRSVEVDIVPFDDVDGRLADLIDGSIGEASMFYESFGYYARGIAETTAVVPEGWRERLVRYEQPSTNGVVTWCLELHLHDLWVAKAVAGRVKDIDFCRALVGANLVDTAVLRSGSQAPLRLMPQFAQWRIVFSWRDGDAYDVSIVDYH